MNKLKIFNLFLLLSIINVKCNQSVIDEEIYYPNSTDNEKEEEYLFLVENILIGYVNTAVIVFGILANIVVLVVLFQPDMKESPFNPVVIALAFSDLTILFSGLPIYGIYYMLLSLEDGQKIHSEWWPKLFAFCYATYHIGLMCSSYCTTALAGARCLSVWKPLNSDQMLTTRNSLITIGTIVVISVAFNVIRGFETTSIVFKASNSTELPVYGIQYSNITTGFAYEYYTNIVTFSVIFFIPSIALVCTNIYIGCEIYRIYETTDHSPGQTAQLAMCLMLVFITSSSLIQSLSRLVQTIYFEIDSYAFYRSPSGTWLRSITMVYCSINSSINIFVYAAYSKKFRVQFCRTIFRSHNQGNVEMQEGLPMPEICTTSN